MADVTGTDSSTLKGKRAYGGRWVTVAATIVVGALIAAIGYFALKYLRDSSYHDERAFRVLGHIVSQFGNLQEAIASAVKQAPYDGNCQDSNKYRQYARRLALRGDTNLEPARVDDGQPTPNHFAIVPEAADRTFRVPYTQGKCTLTLSGSLHEQIPVFITQTLFDTVALASKDGRVLATLPRGIDRSGDVQLHSVANVDLLGGDVSTLLRVAAQREAAEAAQAAAPNVKIDKVAPPTPAEPPRKATVYAQIVGGQSFRVFVMPFEPVRPTLVGSEVAERLYLVGLQRHDVLRSLSDAMGSGGALFITLAVLWGVLAWPLLSLRFSSVQEGIASTQLLAIVLALILIPAVIATAGFSIWTKYRLTAWADQHAELYALRVEKALIKEMDWGLHMLESIAAEVENDSQITESKDGFYRETPANDNYEGKNRNYLCIDAGACPRPITPFRPKHLPMNWSPLRSAVAVDLSGKSSGLRLNFFAAIPSSQAADLADREYFQAILAGQEWRPQDMWAEHVEGIEDDALERASALSHSGHPYVAQRLFNRSDAARALQLAVPLDVEIERPKAKDNTLEPKRKRIGIVTGDTRVYSLTAPMRVPLLRFVVFDHRSGAVLFHSNDQHSLAENLIVESEGNSSLVEAMSRRASRYSATRIGLDNHFAGRYSGAAHRFYHRPIAGTPWGLVILYETDAINTIVLQTAVATLATYFGAVILAALLFVVIVIVLPERADMALLKVVWPKWTSRGHYRWLALGALFLLAVLASSVGSRMIESNWLYLPFLLAVWGSFGALALRIVATRAMGANKQKVPSIISYQRSYLICMFAVLCLISAVPALVIAYGYHDTSVFAFMRDEFLEATRDEEYRRGTLMRDVHRFDDAPAGSLYGGDLSHQLPVPGYVVRTERSTRWERTEVDPAPWLLKCGAPELGPIRRAIWTLSTARQVRRPLASQIRRSDDESRENHRYAKSESVQEASNDVGGEACAGLAVGAWRRDEDGTSVGVVLPVGAREARSRDEAIAIEECPAPRRVSDVTSGTVPMTCRDPLLSQMYVAVDRLVPIFITLACALLVLLLAAHVSRRLFGLRIPFAGRFTESTGNPAHASALLDLELELVRLKNSGLLMTSKDVADWRAVKCAPIYRQMWESLTVQQQLLLHDLARGRYANPENQHVIEQLLRSGYVTLAPWPRIVEPGFEEFIRGVHPSVDLHELRYAASHTPWSQWRAPILVLVIVVAGLLMWLAGSAMHILAGALAGVATLFGSITQVTSYIHREKPATEK